MARQTGIIKLSGTIGDLNFYESHGGHHARRSGGGFNSHDVKNKPSMARVRENYSEFGQCSHTKKYFNRALRPFLCIYKDRTLHGRMMALFMAIKKLDSGGARGQRTVHGGLQTMRGRRLLQDFEFTPSCHVASYLPGTTHYDASSRTFTVSNFNTSQLSYPNGATHMALSLGVLHFDFETNTYELTQSAPLYIDASFADAAFSLQAPAPSLLGTAIALIGVKFYQAVGGQFVVLRGQKAVGLEVVLVEG